ncbi:MAG: hypothetical protein KBS81_01600 [Spirochaetales bacterium]|nr:hypothetical protein [Candidatus Physcosoma equi]
MKRVYFLGDSTCADKKKEARPETGWGEEFYHYLAPGWVSVNCAVNGYSTKSCLSTGAFGSVLLSAREGDYVLIQFGHNDEHIGEEKSTKAFVDYSANLKYMAERLLKKGVKVCFITPVPRRVFENYRPKDTHGDYVAAMKAVAYQVGVPCVDITIPAMLDLALMGDLESRNYYMELKPGVYTNYPEGKEDHTHLRPEGAKWVAELIYTAFSNLSERPEFIK